MRVHSACFKQCHQSLDPGPDQVFGTTNPFHFWSSTNCNRQSDWTRYAKTKRAPVLNQLLGAPLTITIAAAFGVFCTSAVKEHYGVTKWQPIQLLQWILANHYTPAGRAGCFFAGAGFFVSQLCVNIVQNSVAAGMDLASLVPKWIDVTRGSFIMLIIAVVINPWRFVTSPGTFITVLSAFGLFVSPLAGINVADFWMVRRLRWNVPHLYIGDKRGIYWYTAGLNWRAFFAWTVTMVWSMPGFISAVSGAKVAIGWTRTFQITWFVGKFHDWENIFASLADLFRFPWRRIRLLSRLLGISTPWKALRRGSGK